MNLTNQRKEICGVFNKYNLLKTRINFFEILADLSVFAMIFSIFTSTDIPITNITLVIFISIYFLFCKKRINIKAPFNVWSYIMVISYTISYLMFPNNNNALETYFTYLRTIIVGVFIYNYIMANHKNIEKTITFCIISGLYVAIKFFIDNNLANLSLAGTSISQFTIEGVNRNIISMELSITAIFLFYRAKSRSKGYYVLFSICAIESFLTGSRKSVIWIAGGIIIYILIDGLVESKRRKSTIKLLSSIILLFFIVIIFYILIMKIPTLYNILGYRIEGLISLITGKGQVEMSAVIRKNMERFGMKMFWEKAIFGGGFSYFATYSPWLTYSHNNYIETLVSFGLIGFIIHYSIYVYFIKNLLSKKNIIFNAFSSNVYIVLVIFPILMLITDNAMISMDTKHFIVILAIMFSFIEDSVRIYKSKNKI